MCMPVCDGATRHGIIDLDLSTVEMKAISEAFLTHTLVGLSNTLLCRSLPPGSVLRPAVASALDALLKRYAQVQHGTKAPPYLPHKLVLSKLSHPVLLDLWVRELHEAHGSNSQSVCERASRASCAQGCREYIVLLPRKQILWLDKIVCFSMARDGDFFHPPNEHRPK